MEEDGAGDQRVGQDEKATAESNVPSKWRFAPYEAFLQLRARRHGLGDHAAPIDHAALETSAVDSVPPNVDRNVPRTGNTATGLATSDQKDNHSEAREGSSKSCIPGPNCPWSTPRKWILQQQDRIITIRASSFSRRDAEKVFVSSTSPVYSFAGRVYKVDFIDEAT
jgi:hypothetical protein